MKHTFAALAAAFAIGMLIGPGAAHAAAANQGKACHVVGGPNTGKSGTYDEDGDCAGDWGTTGCGGSNAGKCKDGPAKVGKSQSGKVQAAGAAGKSGTAVKPGPTKPTPPKLNDTAAKSGSGGKKKQ